MLEQFSMPPFTRRATKKDLVMITKHLIVRRNVNLIYLKKKKEKFCSEQQRGSGDDLVPHPPLWS